jgi:hypothetical protein
MLPVRKRRFNFRRICCLILLCALCPPSGSYAQTQSQTVTLSLDQARNVAQDALQAGQPDLALQIASGLLQANPHDAFAHFVIAVASAQKNNLRQGRKAAAQAYRYSENPIRKYESAQLAARLAYAEGHPTLTQFWMRRAVQHAPDEATESQIAREYAQVRAQNPWSFNIGLSVQPSDNVNNGADTGLNIIDGVPATGILSPEAQALSGTIGIVDLSLGYRLRGDGQSTTTLDSRLYIKQVRLSADARSMTTRISDKDLASTYFDTSLTHTFAIGGDGFGTVKGSFGRFWSGGDPSYNFGRLSLTRGWRLNAQSGITVNGLVEKRLRVSKDSQDADIFGAGVRYFQRLTNGDLVTFDLVLRDINSDSANNDYTTQSVRAAYNFRNPIGPVQVSTGLTVGNADYSNYRVGFIVVPGGRQDNSVLADVTLFFQNIDYAGFAPTLRVQAGQSTSNVSRFDTKELSVSMGIQSKF